MMVGQRTHEVADLEGGGGGTSGNTEMFSMSLQ